MLDLNLKGRDFYIVQYRDGTVRILTPRPSLFDDHSLPHLPLSVMHLADLVMFVASDGSVAVVKDRYDRARFLLEALPSLLTAD